MLGKVGYGWCFFAFPTTATFNSSPNKLNKLNFCHTIKQLFIHNSMPKYSDNALQKKFCNQFEKGTFSVECALITVKRIVCQYYHRCVP